MTTKTKEDAAIFVPKERTLPVLRKAVQKCRGCDLYRHATQAVFGELENGLNATEPKVSIMMIGEQPGDSEDKEGRLLLDQQADFSINAWKKRDRSTARLCHECGGALQMGDAGQATNP